MASSTSIAKSFALLALVFAGPALTAPFPYDNGQYHEPANEGAYTWKASTVASQAVTSIIGTPAEPSVNPDTHQELLVDTGNTMTSTSTDAATATGIVTKTKTKTHGKKPKTKVVDHPHTPTDAPVTPTTTESSDSSTTSEPASSGGNGKAIQGKGKLFDGDGSTQAGWPSDKEWLSLDALWTNNQYALTKGCQPGDSGAPIQNSKQEIDDIKSGIQKASQSTGVDERYIFACILQESNGCVRVHSTLSPGDNIKNPGLMQSHAGTHDCSDVGSKPCPSDQILGMIMDGTAGTSAGDGLKQLMAKAKSDHKATEMSQQAYIAMRLYNSGDNSLASSDNLSVGGATSSYSSDIANRLIGHVF